MEKDQLISILKETGTKCKDNDGWILLANFGSALKYSSIDIKAEGFSQLADFVSSFPELISIKEDNTFKLPRIFIKFINQVPTKQPQINQNPNFNIKKKSNSSNGLFQWAWMQDYKTVLKRLSELALPERWYYGTSVKTDYFPILGNYLINTFFRLSKENKIVEGNQFAAFNTGLVDKKYKPIYALFKYTTNFTQKWEFNDFCTAGEEWAGKALVSNFKPLPCKANYFNNIVDMIYDTSSGEPSLDDRHIFIENTNRLPIEFLNDNCPKGFSILDTTKMDPTERTEYFKTLGRAIEADEKVYRYMKARLDDAVKLALKRIEWNFKTAIPMYFPTKNSMSLLLPLALVSDDKVDIALVVERTNSGNYLGHTILPLSWAYSNARLVTRPDSDWLVAEEITVSSVDELES